MDRSTDFSRGRMMSPSMIAPDRTRTVVKLAASIRPTPSAIRHNSELAANASIAIVVRAMIVSLLLVQQRFQAIDNAG